MKKTTTKVSHPIVIKTILLEKSALTRNFKLSMTNLINQVVVYCLKINYLLQKTSKDVFSFIICQAQI